MRKDALFTILYQDFKVLLIIIYKRRHHVRFILTYCFTDSFKLIHLNNNSSNNNKKNDKASQNPPVRDT